MFSDGGMSNEFWPGERLVWQPRETLTVSQWADKYRFVSKGPVAQRGPVHWSNELTPYLCEPMDCWNVPGLEEIVMCFAPQTGKTQVAVNCMMFAVHQDPGPGMYVMPKESAARRIVKRRMIPEFKATPAVNSLFSADPEGLVFEFKNGAEILFVWASSAAELASDSIRYGFADETDKYTRLAGGEADPPGLLEVRLNTFPYSKKKILCSTPDTDEGNISKALKDADEIRRYHVKCPWCGTEQRMVWEQFAWPESKDHKEILRKKMARYQCAHCVGEWDDAVKNEAVRSGRWIADEPIENPRSVAFHLPSWYSPFISLSQVVAAYLKGLDDPEQNKIFVTQHMAEGFKEVLIPTRKEDEVLKKHKTAIPPRIVPDGVIGLTAGIDSQMEGFWYVVRAWDSNLTSWLIDYGYLSRFTDIENLLYNTVFEGQNGGRWSIFRAAIDTGGGKKDNNLDSLTRTEEVYQWLRTQKATGIVFGIKGSPNDMPMTVRMNHTVVDKFPRSGRRISEGLELKILDTGKFKGLIYTRLAKEPGQTYFGNPQYFYLHADTGADYVRQLLSEEMRKEGKKTVWKQIRTANHWFDCEVYAAAAADPEWAPSLQMIAKRKTVKPKTKSGATVSPFTGGRYW